MRAYGKLCCWFLPVLFQQQKTKKKNIPRKKFTSYAPSFNESPPQSLKAKTIIFSIFQNVLFYFLEYLSTKKENNELPIF